jgi:uncharacterized protein
MTRIFKYHPDPVATGAFMQEQGACECCLSVKALLYRGPFYAVEEVEDLCADCISNGAAAEKFDGSFNDVWIEDSQGVTAEVIDEIAHRTPGYESWQGNIWLYHCNDGCEFHGNATAVDISTASSATIKHWESLNDLAWSDMMEGYDCKGDVGVYKFICRHCSLVLLHWDRS